MAGVEIVKMGDTMVVDPLDSGLAHGYGLFETLNLRGGRLLFWELHWKRLLGSALRIGMSLDLKESLVLGQVREMVVSQGLRDVLVKLSLLQQLDDARLVVYARPKPPVAKCARLLLTPGSPINERSALVGLKTHNYMENLLLQKTARMAGYDDLVRLNLLGQLGESTVGNLFFVRNGTLYTPSLECGVLPGTVRSVVLGLAELLELEVVTGAFSPKDLEDAEAVFLTNASVGVLPVSAVEGLGLIWRGNSVEHAVVRSLQVALGQAELEQSIDLYA